VNTDIDVQAYAAALRTADISIQPYQVGALSTFVAAAKANGYWTDLIEVYPFCGDGPVAPLYKLKTHSSLSRLMAWTALGPGNFGEQHVSPRTGATSNSLGSAQLYAIATGLTPATHLASNSSVSLGVVLHSMSSVIGYEMGCTGGSSTNFFAFRFNQSAVGGMEVGTGEVSPSLSSTSGSGFYIGSRTGAAVHKMFYNGAQVASNTVAPAALCTNPFTIMGCGLDGGYNTTLHRQMFGFVGNGLTDAKCVAMGADVLTLMKNLRRAIK
jgi:hypothetical protein